MAKREIAVKRRLPKELLEPIAVLGSKTQKTLPRTVAAYALWIWMTEPNDSHSWKDIGQIFAADAGARKAKDRTPPPLEINGDRILKEASSELRRNVLDLQNGSRDDRKLLIQVVKLQMDTTASGEALSYFGAFAKHDPTQKTTDYARKTLRTNWGVKPIFLWAAKEAKLPFYEEISEQTHKKTGARLKKPIPRLLSENLFKESEVREQLSNTKIDRFYSLVLWGLQYETTKERSSSIKTYGGKKQDPRQRIRLHSDELKAFGNRKAISPMEFQKRDEGDKKKLRDDQKSQKNESARQLTLTPPGELDGTPHSP